MTSLSHQRDIGAFIKVQKGIDPTDDTGTTLNGGSIDRRGMESCVLHAACGAATGTPTAQTVDAKIQDSPDGTTGWADLSPAKATTQLVADDTEAEVNVDLSGVKAFIRAVVTTVLTAGTSPRLPVMATIVLGGRDTLPH